jgi:hypothetical protein
MSRSVFNPSPDNRRPLRRQSCHGPSHSLYRSWSYTPHREPSDCSHAPCTSLPALCGTYNGPRDTSSGSCSYRSSFACLPFLSTSLGLQKGAEQSFESDRSRTVPSFNVPQMRGSRLVCAASRLPCASYKLVLCIKEGAERSLSAGGRCGAQAEPCAGCTLEQSKRPRC